MKDSMGKCRSGYNYGDIISTLENSPQAIQLSSSVAEVITMDELMEILQKSLSLAKTVASNSLSSMLRNQFFPFMSSVGTLFFSTVNAATISVSRLDDLIESWKMALVSMTCT